MVVWCVCDMLVCYSLMYQFVLVSDKQKTFKGSSIIVANRLE